MAKRHNSKGRSIGKPRFVALYHWIMDTKAWRDLDSVARCTYIEIARRYAGPASNNGRVPLSVREIAESLHVSKSTALRALRRLQDHGFIILMKRGAFSMKVRHASEWRLTEFPSDITGEMATKDFVHWK